MTRRLLACAVVLAVSGAAPSAARTDPPKHPSAAKREAAKDRATRKRAVARHRAAVRRRETARRKALAEALANVAPAPVANPLAVPVVAVEPTAPASPAVPATPTPSPPVPLARTVGITQREFTLSLSRGTVGAGDVTVQVLNRGEDGHDLRIDDPDGAQVWFLDELAPGGETTPTIVPLVRTGSYRVYCTLPGHAAAGMSTHLTVAAG